MEENKTVKPLSRKEQRAREEDQSQARIRKTLIGVGIVCAVLAVIMVISDINTEKSRTVADKNFDYITDGAEVALPESFGTVGSLAQYKGIEIDKGTVTETTDVLVDYYIASEREADTVVTDITDRAAQLGDFANIDYMGLIDNTSFDGGTAVGQELELGSGSYIEGFEDGVVGMNIGDTKTLELRFPDDYGSTDLAGKDVKFIVTLNSLQTKAVPEFTDEWVKEHTDGEFTDTETYRADYKVKLDRQRTIANAYSKGSSAIQEITDASEVTATADGIKYLYNSNYSIYQQEATSQGMSLEIYLQNNGSDLATFKRNLATYSETTAEQVAVMDAIYAAEGMTLTDEGKANLELVIGMDVEEALESYSQEWIDLNEKLTKIVLYVYDNAVQKPEETEAETSADETTAAVSETSAAETTETATETTAAAN